MTKAELIEAVSKQAADLTKANVQAVVDATFETIAQVLRQDKKFTVPGFGTFVVRSRPGRTGRNPRTGEAITIKPSKTVGFRPSSQLKESV